MERLRDRAIVRITAFLSGLPRRAAFCRKTLHLPFLFLANLQANQKFSRRRTIVIALVVQCHFLPHRF
jgi:hypothetical protein